MIGRASVGAIYDHQWQLGVPYNAQYLEPIEAYQQLSLQRELPLGVELPVLGGKTGEHAGKDIEQIGCGLKDTALASGEQLSGVNTPWHKARDATRAAEQFPAAAVHHRPETSRSSRAPPTARASNCPS